MIVPMKKLYLLCMQEHAEETLNKLAALGVMHITAASQEETEETSQVKASLHDAESVFSDLTAAAAKKSGRGSLILESAMAENGAELVTRILKIKAHLKQCSERLAECEAEKTKQLPFGQFNPEDFSALAAKGFHLALYSHPVKPPPQVPDGVSVFEISVQSGTRYILSVSENETVLEGAQRHTVPSRSLGAVLLQIESCKAEIAAAQAEIAGLSREIGVVERYIKELQERLMFANARSSISAHGSVVYLSGFFPAKKEDVLRSSAATRGWGLLINDVTEGDEAPTLIEYPRWAQPVKHIFDLIDLRPGYNEADISSVFYLAFTLFFAMLVGDAGYGALFLIATIAMRLKFRNAPSGPFILGAVLSLATIAWGVITANYFGFSPEPARFLQIKWLADGAVTNELNMSILCFLIGAVHLTVAHVWRVILMINSTKAIAQVGWILLTWAMYFAAKHLVLGIEISPLFAPLASVGLVMIILFMVPVKQLKTEGIAFMTFPFDVIANFVDVVSYIRLFAVGSAGLAVAMAFNEMALGLGIAGTVLIMLFGHLLNIILCIMGVLVHGIRLNTLEFSGHMGMAWSGFKYSPFAKHTQSGSDENT